MKFGTTSGWNVIDDESQIIEVERESYEKPVVIFKNSTRCGISQSMMVNFQDGMEQVTLENINFYLVDIVKNRHISSAIANTFKIIHESPQVLIIRNGVCTYHKSHWNISFSEVIDYIKKNNEN